MKTEDTKLVPTGIDPFNDRFVVVSEGDMESWIHSEGPIVHETHTHDASLSNMVKRADSLGTRYGRTQIFRLQPIGDLETCRRMAGMS